MSDRGDNKRPELKPVKGNNDLLAFENLERNPTDRRASLHSHLEEASRDTRSSRSRKNNR